jgi:hypothetical protein
MTPIKLKILRYTNHKDFYSDLSTAYNEAVQSQQSRLASEIFDKMAMVSVHIDELWLPELQIEQVL